MNKEQLDVVMNKLFSYVDLDYDGDFCKSRDWFLQRTWTDKEEEEFTYWLKNYIMKIHRVPARKALEEARFFVLAYGWKSED